jgi:hypothetical protein
VFREKRPDKFILQDTRRGSVLVDEVEKLMSVGEGWVESSLGEKW